MRTHDTVIDHLKSAKSDITGEFLEVDCDPYSSFDWKMPSDISAVRVVGIRKNPGEPLVRTSGLATAFNFFLIKSFFL